MFRLFRPSVKNVHPDLREIAAQPGGMFDIEPCELDANVGKWCIIKNPIAAVDWQVFHIDTLQKIYDGTTAYRGTAIHHEYGRPIRPEDAQIFDSKAEASQALKPLMEKKIHQPATYLSTKGGIQYIQIRIVGVVLIGDDYGWRIKLQDRSMGDVPAAQVLFELFD